MTHSSRALLSGADPTLVFRAVGFLEYGAALHYLDRLIDAATPEELEAIEEIVHSRPEFTVYTNLSSKVQQGPSSLTESTQAGTGHERRGLDWVLALARVEYGAMLATFTPQEAPFAVVRPSQYEFAAYQHLLTDGALTHYWALVRDPLLRRVAGMTPGPEMLAYIRRFNLARHFLHAAAHSRAEELNAVQFAELTEQDKYLRDKYDGFRVIVAHYVDRQSFRRTSSATRTVEWARACGAQLRAETAEIQLGTARIEYRE